MSLNKEALNYFASSMVDLQLDRNPLAQEVIVIFNSVTRDHYQDSVVVEECRIKKMAIVKKDPDMSYVQQLGDILLEDDEHVPWIVSLTTTGLLRIPKQDDQILIDGTRYYVSYVKPANRSVDSIINLSIYPDRYDEDKLQVYSLSVLEDGCIDILYGGQPIEMSFDIDSIADKSKREEFKSIVSFPTDEGVLVLFDPEGNYVTYKFKLNDL